MSKHWTDRVKEKADELRLSDAAIAKAIGCSKASFSNWMQQQRDPKLEYKIAIADVLGVSVHWLQTGTERPGSETLPYISLEEVTSFMQELEAKRQQVGKDAGIRIIESDNDSFLLRMDNDTMMPRSPMDAMFIPKGASVQVDTGIEPEPGKILLIEHNNELTLRLWYRISGSTHSLRFINDLYANYDIHYNGNINDIYKGTAVGVSYPL